MRLVAEISKLDPVENDFSDFSDFAVWKSEKSEKSFSTGSRFEISATNRIYSNTRCIILDNKKDQRTNRVFIAEKKNPESYHLFSKILSLATKGFPLPATGRKAERTAFG